MFTDGKSTGYHIFLLPAGVVKEKASATIRELSQTYGGEPFDPHVTLLHGISPEDSSLVKGKAHTLARELAPFPLTLGNIGAEDYFFRALYVQVVITDSLRDAHVAAVRVFKLQDQGTYHPHMSLFYGSLPAHTKEEIIPSLDSYAGITFMVDRLHVYQTEGSPKEWKLIAEYPFGE
ncbi:MAG: 2'-5' RNA ligase family protein [Minisyncoccia bacterium]